jgi:RES domain-containing protein
MMASLSRAWCCWRIDAFLRRLTVVKGIGAVRSGAAWEAYISGDKSLTKAGSSGTIPSSVGA